MRGKDINLTVTAGVSHERVIKVYKENGEEWPIENIAVSGQLWDMRMGEILDELECKVTEEGQIEVRFPDKEVGRYIFAVQGESDDGQVTRIISGYIGYEGPEMVEEGIEDGEALLVYIDGERRKALFGRNLAWEEKYKYTQEVAGQIEEVNKKLERAEYLDESINGKLSEFIVPDDSTGTWVVGGVDTGKPYKGADGMDGNKLVRVVLESTALLPENGDGGTYYYVQRETDGEYDVYTWLLTAGIGAWVNIREATDPYNMPLATTTTAGAVKLGRLRHGYADEVPTCEDTLYYIENTLVGYASIETLTNAITAYDEQVIGRNYLTEEQLGDYVTEERLNEAIDSTHSGMVSSAFGTKIVELSETEYSLLESYDEDTYYLTYAD